MDKPSWKLLIRSVVIGTIWAVILIVFGFWLEYTTGSPFVDILFFEGGILIILGGLSLLGGIPAGFSLKGLGRNDGQYIAGIQIAVEQKESEVRKTILKNKISYAFNAVSLLLGGGICILIDIIMVMGIEK